MTNRAAVASLSLRSPIGEMIRAMFMYSADHMMIVMSKRELLVHKDQLIELMELGNDNLKASDVFKKRELLAGATKLRLEDVPQSQRLIVLDESGVNVTTFENYREEKIKKSTYIPPSWWEIPLPLISLEKNKIHLNKRTQELIGIKPEDLARMIKNTGEERIITIVEKGIDRTYSLIEIEPDIFFLEDISGDFEMAEDLVWWAAAGRALAKRLEENGLTLHRYSPFETPHGGEEIIPCLWDGDLIGKLGLSLPEEPAPTEISDEPQANEIAAEEVAESQFDDIPSAEPSDLPDEIISEERVTPPPSARTAAEAVDPKSEKPKKPAKKAVAGTTKKDAPEAAGGAASTKSAAPRKKKDVPVEAIAGEDKKPTRKAGTTRVAKAQPANIADEITSDETSLLITETNKGKVQSKSAKAAAPKKGRSAKK